VCKPVRGRGSEGVEVVNSPEELLDYAQRAAEARRTLDLGLDDALGMRALADGRVEAAARAALAGPIGATRAVPDEEVQALADRIRRRLVVEGRSADGLRLSLPA